MSINNYKNIFILINDFLLLFSKALRQIIPLTLKGLFAIASVFSSLLHSDVLRLFALLFPVCSTMDVEACTLQI